MNMEDAHIAGPVICSPQFPKGASLFAVFDGHGGQEVASYCALHLPEQLEAKMKAESHISAAEAMKQSFHELDVRLRTEEGDREIARLRGQKEGSTPGSGSPLSMPTPKRKAVSLLQSSIQGDLTSAKDRGSLSREDAQKMMVKMMFLKRLEARAGRISDEERTSSSGSLSEGREDDGEDPTPPKAADNVGCAAVSALVFPAPRRRVIVANAGDSRCVLSRAGGQAVNLSFDHKPQEEAEKQRIEAAGGYVEEIPTHNGARTQYRVNGNLNLSRSLGDLSYKRRRDLPPESQVISGSPDITETELTDDDEFLVLACDGVWDIMTSQSCVDFIRPKLMNKAGMKEIAEQILDHCMTDDPKENQGLGADNMTCIIVLLKPPEEFK